MPYPLLISYASAFYDATNLYYYYYISIAAYLLLIASPGQLDELLYL